MPLLSNPSPSNPGRSTTVCRARRLLPTLPKATLPATLAVLAISALLALGGCGGRGDRVPRGLTFAGDADQIRPVLARLEGLTGAPVAQAATRATEAIAGCERVVGRCEVPEGADAGSPSTGGCDLAASLRCADDGLPNWVETLRGDAGWVFAGSTEPGHWLVVRGTSEGDGSVRLDGEVYPAGIEGPISLLLPADEPAGPPHMNDAQSLIHVRLRPDGGLNLARFIEGGDWGARLYRLQSKLFEGTALSGTWELAVYPPEQDQRIPPMALALDIRDRDLAVQVMEKFLDDLMATWPARRNDFALDGWSGACLSNVRVMPDLSPCYVATADTLLIGWNAGSLRQALAGRSTPSVSAPGSDWSDQGSEARVYFSRFPPVDALMAQVSGTTPLPSSFYPWDRLDLQGHRGEDSYLFHAELVAP